MHSLKRLILAGFSLVTCPAFCGSPLWQNAFSGLVPPQRYRTAAVYDALHNQIVMFGGFGQASNLDDTWIWNGTNWLQQSVGTKPSPRNQHAMAYDVKHGQVVLFGGYNSSGVLNDTWVWDGNTWSQKFPSTMPSARAAHAMAYDPAREEVVLFGGFGNDNFADTWVWDGANWIQKNPMSTPAARYGHAMISDDAHGQVVLFGGALASSPYYSDETWTWDGSNWTKKSPVHLPVARAWVSLAYDGARSRVVLFGGSGPGNHPPGTFEWDGTDWSEKTFTSPIQPPSRDGATFVYLPSTARSYVFGGYGLYDTWAWSGFSWSQVLPSGIPAPRMEHQMVYDAARGNIVMYGGFSVVEGDHGSTQGSQFFDTWIWDGSSWNLQHPVHRPSQNSQYALAYDAARNEVIYYGGAGTWTWNGSDWIQRTTGGSPGTPTARQWMSMAYDSLRQQTVLFGGYSNGALDETWVWNGSSWTQKFPSTKPAKRAFANMAFDRKHGQVVLFGGRDPSSGTGYTDTWTWDGTSWIQNLPAHQPSGGGGMAYDPFTERVMMAATLFGTWAWDGTDWSDLQTAPEISATRSVAFDEGRRQLVVFGGLTYNDSNGLVNDTWLLNSGTTPSGSIQVSTNLAASTFTIAGPTTYNGSGTSFSQPNAPAGQYTITYGALSGYTTPASETKTLSAGGTVSFTGTYQQPTNPVVLVIDTMAVAPGDTYPNSPPSSYVVGILNAPENPTNGSNYAHATAFVPTADYTLASIVVPIGNLNTADASPAMTLSLANDSSGLPGTIIETFTVSGILANTSSSNLSITLTSTVHPALHANSKYWLIGQTVAPHDLAWRNMNGYPTTDTLEALQISGGSWFVAPSAPRAAFRIMGFTTGSLTPTSSLGGTPSPSRPQAFASEPVNTATGNYFTAATDLVVPGKGLQFAFTRSYNSADTYSGSLGPGWTHSFNVKVIVNPDSSVSVKDADGSVSTFILTAGTYVPQTTGVFDSLVRNADNTLTLTRKNQTKLNFAATGQLSSIVDRNGNTQLLAYTAAGLSSITDSSGRIYSLVYNGTGNLVRITDPLGRAVQYSYDATGRLSSVTDPPGAVTQYTYDSGNRLLTGIDGRGNTYVQNTYDGSGRVSAQKNARGFVTTFAYNTPSAGTTTIVDPLGNTTKHVYDATLRLVAEIDALGGTTTYSYDSNNLRISVTDPLGHIQAFTYDAGGNTTSMKDAAGKTTSFTYDGKNNLLSTTDRLNRTTKFTYDSKGNLLTATDADGAASMFTYDASGQVLTAKNPRGFTTLFQYDGAGNLTKTTDPLGGIISMTYDAVGRLLSVQNQLGKTTSRTYDGDNRLLFTTDPLSHTTSFIYDANGNLTKITDANGNATQYAYDATNKLSKVTDAIGGITQYQYNGNTDLTAITDANGHMTSYTYDPLRRLSVVTDPLGRLKHYGYDATGNVTSTIDGNSKTNSFAYDALNRLISMALSDGKGVSYTYDAVGNRLTMVDWHGTTMYSYDTLNRANSIKMPDGATVAYGYDSVGNRTTLTYPDGRVLRYSYDGLNRLISVTDWASKTTTYSYDAAGNLMGFAHPNGASSSYQYDAANRLLNVSNSSRAKLLSSFTYTLDSVGNRLQMTTAAGGVNKYGYDGLYRLTSWTAPSAQVTQWLYDAVGNRTKTTSTVGTTNYTYDSADQLLSAGPTTFTYDGNGNQLSKATGSSTVSYAWDALNRLISVVGGTVNTHYVYDGDGNRIGQQVPAGTYAYINDLATALPVVIYESGPDGSIAYAHGLSLVSATSPAFQYYHQFDGVGSTINVTDQTGVQKANYSYDPWGKLTLALDPLGTKDKHKFAGEVYDADAALIFLRARYYDFTVGHFINRDPLARTGARAGGYRYAGDAPTRFVDPSGLAFIDYLAKSVADTYAQLPSFLGCSASFFNAEGACKKQGFSDAQIAIGKDVGTAETFVITGSTGVLVKSSIEYTYEGGQLAYRGATGTLTPSDLQNASEDVLLWKLTKGLDVFPTETTKYLFNKYLFPLPDTQQPPPGK